MRPTRWLASLIPNLSRLLSSAFSPFELPRGSISRWLTPVLALSLALSACSSQPGSQPRPGDVNLEDSPTRDDSVSFYFDERTKESVARKRALAALAGASLKHGEVDVSTDEEEGYVRARVETSLGTGQGFLERSIDRAIVSSLSRGGRVLVELQPTARLDSKGQQIESNPLERTFRVPVADIAYHFSVAHLAVLVVLTLTLVALPYPVLRWYVTRLRRRQLDRVEKVHRLQRLLLVTMTCAPIGLLALMFVGGVMSVPLILIGELFPTGSGTATPIAFFVGIMLISGGFVFSVLLPIQPYYRELRDIRQSPRESRNRMIRGIAVGVGFPLLWFTVLNVVQTALPEGWTQAFGTIALILVILAVAPIFVMLIFGRGRMDPRLHEELLRFTRELGLKVRDVGVIKGRSEKLGNALIVGLLPRLKYIFVTDYLVDAMSEEELKAVVAHEIGHGKRHHLLFKFGVPFVVIFGIAALMALAAALESSALAPVLVTLPILVIVAIVVLQGVVGIRLEKSADDYACETVGLEATVSALDKLAEINMAKRKPGRVFSVLSQHPGIEERVQRLRRRASEAEVPT